MKYVKPTEDTVYPDPRSVDDVEWELRYGGADAVRLAAASVVAAYAALFDPDFGEERYRLLRKALSL